MASHQLAIAKAAFSAGLLRPDPTSLSRDEIAHFHTLLNDVVTQCTPQNVQKSKRWILENIVQSTARCTALGKYLTSLSASFSNSPTSTDSSKREPSVKRKRLHLLYLINDILHHAKYRSNDASVCSKLQPILVPLFESAAAPKTGPKHLRKISDLLDIWEEKSYYSSEYIGKLRETVKNTSESGPQTGIENETAGIDASAPKTSKALPFVMPAMHGDPATPWFDLPAANLIPHIVPNSTRPINPELVKPLQFMAGPADENLVVAVKALLDDVEIIFGANPEENDKVSWDIDELGQRVELDEITGEVLGGEGYYGWSRAFCEKMKKRRNGGNQVDRGRRSRSRSYSPSKKRRYSDSDDDSTRSGHGRSRRRRSSYSSSRSPSPNHRRRRYDSSSRSRSRHRSPGGDERRPDSYGRDLEPESRFRDTSERAPSHSSISPNPPPPPFAQGFNPNFPPPPPPPTHMQNVSYNGAGGQYGGWPVPPPPPPPPPPPHNPYQNPYFNPAVSQPGAWPPPPPPPPGPGGWYGQPPPPPPPPPPSNGSGQMHNGWNHPQYGRGGRGAYRG
ncbi:hypothetical protein F5884DRAFT_737321 [Xylogone sp. PMI_703]|nr:hypothetical protein F5884DRAFT_737321 [Xylogone sp. PMI_703]